MYVRIYIVALVLFRAHLFSGGILAVIIEYTAQFGHEERIKRVIQVLGEQRTVGFGNRAPKSFGPSACGKQESSIFQAIPDAPPRAIETPCLLTRQVWPLLPTQDGFEVEPSAKCPPKGGLLLQATHSI